MLEGCLDAGRAAVALTVEDRERILRALEGDFPEGVGRAPRCAGARMAGARRDGLKRVVRRPGTVETVTARRRSGAVLGCR
jgi:hypothetical protein